MECPLCGETHSNADMLGHIWECEERRQLKKAPLHTNEGKHALVDAIERMVLHIFPEDNRFLTESERNRLKALLPQIIELLEPFIEDGSLDIYDSYAPGGSFVPTEGEPSPTVFVANWNTVQRYDRENRELVELDNSMNRLGKILEALPGAEVDWVDEIIRCDGCYKAISTTPGHAFWKHKYALVGQDVLCGKCLQEDPYDFLKSLEHEGATPPSPHGSASGIRVFAEDKLGIEFQYHEYGIDPTEHDYRLILKVGGRLRPAARSGLVSRVLLSLHQLDSKSPNGISYLLAEDGPDGENTTIYMDKDVVYDWIDEAYDIFLNEVGFAHSEDAAPLLDELVGGSERPRRDVRDTSLRASADTVSVGEKFMSYLLEHPDKIPDWPRNFDKVHAEVKLRNEPLRGRFLPGIPAGRRND